MVMQIIVMLSVLSIKPLYANPDEIHVFPGESIQTAINTADPGDSIIVHEGTYSENVDVNKTVNLLAQGAVIVNAATSQDEVFDVTANYVNITGFTVAGANWGYGRSGFFLDGVNHCNISNNNATDNYHGIMLWGLSSSCKHNVLSNNTVNSNVDDGIVLEYSCEYNTLINNTANGNSNGIALAWFTTGNNTLVDNTANSNYHGIVITGDNNTLTNNTAKSNTDWDFRSSSSSNGNVVFNLTVGSYPTTLSFTYDNGIKLKGVETAPSNPIGMVNIGKYVEIVNETVNSWIYLNVSYSDAEILYVVEESLKLYKWNVTTEEWLLADGSGINGVNTAKNYVYANITGFSIFAPFGDPTAPVYRVTINTDGLTIPLYTTHLYVDDFDQGEPYLWDGLLKLRTFLEGETHAIRVDEYVSDGVGTRHHCATYSWTTASSGDQTHTFTYVTQYRLIVASEHDSASPPVGDNWYDDAAEVTASVMSPADETDGTRYRCTGWTGTGAVPESGTETTAVLTITEPSSIT